MKIFKKINHKDKGEKKALFYSAFISIIIGQIVALLIWYIFNENYFVALFFGSIIGFLFGYRGLKKT